MTGMSFLFDPIALGLVLGGTLIATLLRGPLSDTLRAFAALGRLVRPGFDAAAVRAQLAQAERVARDRGCWRSTGSRLPIPISPPPLLPSPPGPPPIGSRHWPRTGRPRAVPGTGSR
ncbi:MotA/TolQ/ExbB proton channel family protein [Sphingomonas changnyeongensis]|uniref:hypothetical protein n=1 Tax=Sphingomonas changnyeongensis TaxID=2698679 RepID=UPI001E3FB07F|nr:hypothetical protein [Sphingomonas changnyeongensis]